MSSIVLNFALQEILPSVCGSLIAIYYLYVHGYPIAAPFIQPIRRLSPIIQLAYAQIFYAVAAFAVSMLLFGAVDARQYFLASLATSLIICGRISLVLRVGATPSRSFVMRIAAG